MMNLHIIYVLNFCYIFFAKFTQSKYPCSTHTANWNILRYFSKSCFAEYYKQMVPEETQYVEILLLDPCHAEVFISIFHSFENIYIYIYIYTGLAGQG